jgi:hypothetical protein
MTDLFQAPLTKLSIASCERGAQALSVRAQYNPKELALDMPVPWTEHGDEIVEFGHVACRSLTVELLFDGFEQATSIQPYLDVLVALASPVRPIGHEHVPHRPHLCVVAWGERGIPPYRCVIESLSTKYVKFGRDGAPLRAVATLKLKEVDLARQLAHDEPSPPKPAPKLPLDPARDRIAVENTLRERTGFQYH